MLKLSAICRSLVCIQFSLCASVNDAQATSSLGVQLVKSPKVDSYGTWLATQIVGGDDNDPTPNQCYMDRDCYLGVWVVDEAWPLKRSIGYFTRDKIHLQTRRMCGSSGSTVGEVIKCLRENGVLYIDYVDVLPFRDTKHPENAEACLFLNPGLRQSARAQGPLGPCAKAYAPAACKYDGSLDVSVRGNKDTINNPAGFYARGGGVSCVIRIRPAAYVLPASQG